MGGEFFGHDELDDDTVMHTCYRAVAILVRRESEASVRLDLSPGMRLMFSRFEFNRANMNCAAGPESNRA